MKIVLTYGTFDLFHIGHLRLLKRLREMGDKLVVGCSTDAFNNLKGKSTIIPYDHRVEILMGCRYVDEVFPENNWDQKISDIKRYNASIFAMGHDWSGKFDHLSEHCKVIYLPRTEDISTTDLKQIIQSRHDERLATVKREAEKLYELISAL